VRRGVASRRAARHHPLTAWGAWWLRLLEELPKAPVGGCRPGAASRPSAPPAAKEPGSSADRAKRSGQETPMQRRTLTSTSEPGERSVYAASRSKAARSGGSIPSVAAWDAACASSPTGRWSR
jgi:hypothetical protein